MHEFNITIKLENKDYCNGCPLLNYTLSKCTKYNIRLNHNEAIDIDNHLARIRPDICKEQNKEMHK